jgi:hypothetical protein
MTEPIVVAVIVAVAGLGGVWLGQWLGGHTSRKDRLRALYAEVMAAALRLTPYELGYKLSADTDIPQPAQVDAFVARLMVEAEEDDDKVRRAFIGVFNMSMLYGIKKAEAEELTKTAALVKKNLEDLQNAMRERLK